MNLDSLHPYRLEGRSLTLARLGWASVALLMLAPTLISWMLYYNLLRTVCEACLLTSTLMDTLIQIGVGHRWWDATAWRRCPVGRLRLRRPPPCTPKAGYG